MPRQKLSELRAKTIVSAALAQSYVGWGVGVNANLSKITGYPTYVVKVDQAVKGRFKKGLVLLDVAKTGMTSAVKQLTAKGYSSFIIEPHMAHEANQERYLALNLVRGGYVLSYSQAGGINVEQHANQMHTTSIDARTDWQKLSKATQIPAEGLQALVETARKNFISFLEINPYVVDGEHIVLLDCAIEVDDAGAYFTREWGEGDLRTAAGTNTTAQEQAVMQLAANSPASFKLAVLNKDGGIFLLLSGGGASIVIADEVYNMGLGKQLANYGEYSGNPNTEETYIYTKQVLALLLQSKAKHKILFVGGAVANFTDIANTFAGVMQAISERADELLKQKVRIFVRRGGPRQEIGLAKIQALLEQTGLLGGVYDPSTSITDALHKALEGMKP